MTQFSLTIAHAIADAVIPKEATNVLLLPRIKRKLQQMEVSKSDIKDILTALRVHGSMLIAEHQGKMRFENGEPVYDFTHAEFDVNEQSATGFSALNKDAVDRGKLQLFIDEKLQDPLRTIFIAALTGIRQAGEAKSAPESLPGPPPAPPEPLEDVRRPKVFLVKHKQLASTGANLLERAP